jgi:hypothetical protein
MIRTHAVVGTLIGLQAILVFQLPLPSLHKPPIQRGFDPVLTSGKIRKSKRGRASYLETPVRKTCQYTTRTG